MSWESLNPREACDVVSETTIPSSLNFSAVTAVLKPRRWYRSPWFLAPTLLLVAAIVWGLAWRTQRLAAIPDVPEPFDVEAFIAAGVPDDENAFTDYREAARLVREFSGPVEEQLDFLGGRPTEVPASVEAWLAANRPAMERWRQGTQKPRSAARHLSEIHLQESLDELPRMVGLRELARLASAQGRALRIAGDLPAALEWHLAHLRFGQHLTHRPSFNGWWIACAFRSQAYQDLLLWVEDPQVALDEIEALFSIVEDSPAACAPYSESLRSAYVLCLDRYHRMPAYLEMERAYMEANPPAPPGRWPRVPSWLEYWALHEPAVSARALKLVVANLLLGIDLPPRDRPPLFPAQVCLFDCPLPAGVTPLQIERASRAARCLGSLSPSILDSIDADRLRPTLIRTALAVCAWRKVHGELPQTLEEVVAAGWLPELPDDPMAAVPQALRYERWPDDPQRAVVWSVGRDGVDDGDAMPGDYGDLYSRDRDWSLRLGDWRTGPESDRLHVPAAASPP